MAAVRKHVSSCLFCSAILFLCTSPLDAQQQQNPKRLSITDLAIAEPDAVLKSAIDDFHVQGEYLGELGLGRRSQGRLGLQVVALGDGQFQAVAYRGGLPGYGWSGGESTRLTGSRSESVPDVTLILESPELQIQIKGSVAQVFTAEDQFLGALNKIHRVSRTLHARASRNAVTLFDGSNTDQFENGRITEDGLLMTGTTTRMAVNDFHLHLEFRTPYMPYARGQGRGNSGVYIQRRYEVQILDSFGLKGEHNECGGLYRQQSPAINMCLPPLSWQTYDIYFRTPRWNEEKQKTANAVITVYHNGVLIHDQQEITNKTGAGKPEGPEALPIHLQHHGNPVHFTNVWIEPMPATSPSDIMTATRRRCRLLRVLKRIRILKHRG